MNTSILSMSDKSRIRALKTKPWEYDQYKFRRYYTDDELNYLYNEHKTFHIHYNPISKKIHKNYKLWRLSFNKYLDKDSLTRFFFKYETNIPKCNYDKCGCELTIAEYSYTKIYDGSHFRKYCSDCLTHGNYRKYIKSTSTIEKIQASRKKWVDSDAGKLAYKKIGENNSKKLKIYFSTEEGREQIERSKEKQSNVLKEKIKNGEFTPNITNTWTHWDATIVLNENVYKFRSSWEAAFYVSNQHLLYEFIRIPYKLNGKDRSYIADFFDEENNIVYEIKPISQYNKHICKLTQVIQYCINHNMKFIWINEKNILNYIDETDFSDNNKIKYDKMYKGINAKNKN